MREIHRHMDLEEAERYLMGDSPDEEAAHLEVHLLVCASCRERISNTDGYLSSMGDAAAELRAPAIVEGGRQVSMLLAVVVAVACLLLLGMLALRYY